jgi:SAM-dependent methyltransferase
MRERDMTVQQTQSTTGGTYSPKEYWSGVAQAAGSGDVTGLAPVLHPLAPAWFNALIDKLQYQAMRRALRLANVATGAHVLDVGCGTGRWVRRYQGLGFHALGVDATSSMLAIARERGTTAPLIAGEAYCLPFVDAQFDCVSDITVVQHIPVSMQAAALSEMMRVLKPGGRLILIELIRGSGSHIFPHRPHEWIDQAAAVGASLVGWFGQEYMLLDRVFVRAAHIMTRSYGPGAAETAFFPPHPTVARRAYWALRQVTAPLSAWIDPTVERILPPRLATHGVFVFRKP